MASYDVPLYDMISCNEPRPENSNLEYSVVSMATVNKENVYSEAAACNNVSQNNKSNRKVYLLAIFTSVAILVVIFGCFTAVFLGNDVF